METSESILELTKSMLLPLENINSSIEKLYGQLNEMNSSIGMITEKLNDSSFLDSQLFGVIIGASVTLASTFLGKYVEIRHKNNEIFEEMIRDWAEQGDFYAPKELYDLATHTTYAQKGKDEYGKVYEAEENLLEKKWS